MNGYLRIKNTDLYERDGVTYWRNGGNIIGNVVKAVIEENDVITSETYYIESLKTAKPIMLDPDVKIGGLTASESKNGNFIIVETAPADFTEYGGGIGIKITFIYGVNYYSIETVESNGDIKIYDPDGESGTITPDALPDTTDAAAGNALVLDEDKKPIWNRSTPIYEHNIRFGYQSGSLKYYTCITIINNSDVAMTVSDVAAWLKSTGRTGTDKCLPAPYSYSYNHELRQIYGIYSTDGLNVSFTELTTTVSDGILNIVGATRSISSGGTDTIVKLT